MSTETTPLIISFDGGWYTLKAFANGKRESLVHTVIRVTEQDWQAMCEVNPESLDMIKVDGVPYAFGETAIKMGFVRSKRAARYVHGYYDIQYLRMLVPYLQVSSDVQRVFAAVSYPPADNAYASDLRQLVRGERIIITPSGKTYLVDTQEVITFPELSGSLTNFLTGDLATDERRKKMVDGTSVVVDIGGGTTDVCEALAGLQTQLATAVSRDIGAGSIERAFERALRTNFKDIFRAGINDDVLREAFKAKKVRVGKAKYSELNDIIEGVVNIFFAQLDAMIEHFGGWYSFEYVGFTGGGSDLLREEIERRYGADHNLVFLGKEGDMQFSNVVGGQKLLKATIKKKGWK